MENNTTKSTRSKQMRKFKLTLPLVVEGTTENKDAAIDVISNIPFNNFRVPVYAKKCDVIEDSTDERTIIVGYIKGYDAEKAEMSMIIFNQYTNSLKNKEGSSAKVVYNTYEEKFTTIVRIEIEKQ